MSNIENEDKIKHLKDSLNLAFSLMTSYQRERFQKIFQKQATKVGREKAVRLGKMGRPKKFNGHSPGHTGTASERTDVP